MLKLGLLLFLAVTGMAGSALATENPSAKFPCPPQPLVIEIIPSLAQTQTDLTVRSVDLSSSAAWGETKVQHITATAHLISRSGFKAETDKDLACVRQRDTVVTYRLQPKILIKNPYPEGSCEYQQTQAHIQAHIDLSREFLEKTTPLLESYLMKGMESHTSLLVRQGETEKAQMFIEQVLNNKLAIAAQDLREEFEIFQSTRLDTPQHMQELFARCPGWQPPQLQ